MSQIELRNPFTGDVVFSHPSESFEEVNARIDAAQAASHAWRKLSPARRAEVLMAALDYFRTHRDEIGTGISREMGKPRQAAADEIDFMLERAEYLCRFASDGALAPHRLDAYQDESFQGRIESRAKGVVYVITPWNYPLFCAINGTMCALLSGSAVILKHTTTPSVGAHFEKAFGSLAGIDDLLVNVTVDFDVSARLIEESDINHVVFTGSVRGGQIIQQSVAQRAFNDVPSPFIECSLELGSSDAAYIAEDADLDDAAMWTVKIGRLHNSGQSCCAVKRVYVHEALHDAFVEKAKAIMEAEVNGDPMAETTTLGPLFGGSREVERLMEMIKDAEKKGARVVCGGTTETIGAALFLKPTLLADADGEMRVLNEETFGPVLPVVKVANDEEGMAQVSRSRYGLTASIFTTSRERAERFVEAIESGTVYVNRCNFVDARLGWIGHKHSGNGSLALSPLGLSAYSYAKSVNVDPSKLS
ncbi:aldehyde dehydrogenase family protein [Litchfieldella rifensis]|uniref:Aldehyde dehydrogenase family protein n=1 Tax=Litchfieldella rifensis TaxID=762643 RepID=A0ABV7LV90_9GAMM